MNTYSILTHSRRRTIAVSHRDWNWAAFFFGGWHALFNGLFGAFFALLALGTGISYISSCASRTLVSALMLMLLCIIVRAAYATVANGMIKNRKLYLGYKVEEVRESCGPEAAIEQFIRDNKKKNHPLRN